MSLLRDLRAFRARLEASGFEGRWHWAGWTDDDEEEYRAQRARYEATPEWVECSRLHARYGRPVGDGTVTSRVEEMLSRAEGDAR